MATIDKQLIQELRDRTGLGMMDCKNALEQTGGNVEQAIEFLRKKGSLMAAKRAGIATAEGIVHAYIHPGDRIGVMVEINCETDFVARTKDVAEFAKDLCMHIAAARPLYLDSSSIDTAYLEKEKEIVKEQLIAAKKPVAMIDQIMQGKLNKTYSEICLLNQTFVKNDQHTIQDILTQLIAKTGENIVIKRFSRFEIGA